jgi:serine/threonine protein kinase
MGTPSPMAPELARGAVEIGPLVDIYALGAILLHVVSGQRFLAGLSRAQALRALAHRPPAPRPADPPAIPTLAVVLCVARLRGARVVVDWHNFGYSILALSLGERHALVRVSEGLLGRLRSLRHPSARDRQHRPPATRQGRERNR